MPMMLVSFTSGCSEAGKVCSLHKWNDHLVKKTAACARSALQTCLVYESPHTTCALSAWTSLLNLKTWVFVFCFSGSKNSIDCTLILTEGDSAKTLAVSGLGVVGRDKYGVFPLRGKMLNVREASHKQVSGKTWAIAGSCGVLCHAVFVTESQGSWCCNSWRQRLLSPPVCLSERAGMLSKPGAVLCLQGEHLCSGLGDVWNDLEKCRDQTLDEN